MPGVIVSVRGLKKRFSSGKGELHVLRGVDLDIQKGEMVTIVGASGVGKSTLLQIMGGLDRPTEGSVQYEGLDIFGLGDSALAAFRNRHVGFVFQFHHLLQEFTALENVVMPAMIKGMETKKAEKRARGILDDVGLSDRGHHRPGELSGGEQQRVSIMRALMLDPSLLLMDEPLGALDPMIRYDLQQDLKEIFRQLQKTVIMVTHDISEAAFFGDEVLLLRDGRLVQQGSIDDLLHKPADDFVR
ncbi:MAG TPA: ABC transporter ATP-binding protein, partial [Nitrospirota bacterium]